MADDEFQPFYHWWTMWVDDGRQFASPFRTISPATARASHDKALRFGWAAGKEAAGVSDLWFYRETDTDVVREGGWR